MTGAYQVALVESGARCFHAPPTSIGPVIRVRSGAPVGERDGLELKCSPRELHRWGCMRHAEGSGGRVDDAPASDYACSTGAQASRSGWRRRGRSRRGRRRARVCRVRVGRRGDRA